jgi:flagellar biosynthesis protein FliQ
MNSIISVLEQSGGLLIGVLATLVAVTTVIHLLGSIILRLFGVDDQVISFAARSIGVVITFWAVGGRVWQELLGLLQAAPGLYLR